MPCSAAKARRLLRDGKAKVIRREPFTIRLNYCSSGYRQPVTLGVDAGSVHIGLAAKRRVIVRTGSAIGKTLQPVGSLLQHETRLTRI